MRRGSIVQLVLYGLIATLAAGTLALVPPWLPDEASEEAGRINFVFWFVTVICIVIFAVVTAVIVYSLLKFRARPDDDSDGAPIHGHTGLEIVWTAVPTVLVIAIAVVSAVVLARNEAAGAEAMRVDVTAQQFAWSFKYPQQNDITSGTLRLPLGRPVRLHLRALDVIHSFWVPQFGQKQDTVPGIETTLQITPNRLGVFPVVCTELCGLGHAVMRTQAIVMRPDEFDAWARRQGEAVAGGNGAGAAGAAVFSENGCGGCHVLEKANASGRSGPSLEDLAASAEEAGKPLEEYVRESVVEPDAYIHPGFQASVMPKTYSQLPDEQLDALVQYLVEGQEGT